MDGTQHHVYHTKLDASGRIVIPVEVRQRRNLGDGQTLVVVDDARGLHVKTLDEVVSEAQDYFLNLVPASVSLVDELVAERQAEAARE